jgi:AraC-like DNA-binding protein
MNHAPSSRDRRELGGAALTAPGAATVSRGWTRVPITRIEDLSEAVYGAGLDAMQISCGPVTGSLSFAEWDGIVLSAGRVDGTVALRGPLSGDMITLGIGLELQPGSRQWLNEVSTRGLGVYLPGDDHDALYMPGSRYVTLSLTQERLEILAARQGILLDPRRLGTGIDRHLLPEDLVTRLRAWFDDIHEAAPAARSPAETGASLLPAILAHVARPPHIRTDGVNRSGYALVVARARDFIFANLDRPLSIDVIAAAANASQRTLYRAFTTVLDETPQSYVRKVRLHRIRSDLATAAEVTVAASQWGVGDFGRLSARYRALFGELPSQTLARLRHPGPGRT